MSSSRIPNLNTLRTSRPPGRGRGKDRGPDFSNDKPSSSVDNELAKDRIVQQTDQDASVSRMSAVELGYLDDPYAKDFVIDKPQRRYPIINRGLPAGVEIMRHKRRGLGGRLRYMADRNISIDTLVDKFLASDLDQQKQIISLGAGSDTRYFRLMKANPSLRLLYHELDFASNTSQKIASIKQSPHLLSLLHLNTESFSSDLQISEDGSSLHSQNYNIHALDLRNLRDAVPMPEQGDLEGSKKSQDAILKDQANEVLTKATADPSHQPSPPPASIPNLDATLPTLLISECCLIYLPPPSADAILHHFTTVLFPPSTPLALLIYEPINPADAFGRVMVSNLAARGIALQTLKKYSSLARQMERMRVMGFGSGQRGADIDFIWEKWITQEEKERVGGLEMLDEVEEWRMLARHYCVCWGWRDGVGHGAKGDREGAEGTFGAWKALPAQDADE
ncbi:MAG: carboxy methyl transferase for protein phosphatase 2A [Pycnora praestabilis]|nr:MAG: carboxy methyl transferase for protein phosphatase 2A [Pycnora praestabilis]